MSGVHLLLVIRYLSLIPLFSFILVVLHCHLPPLRPIFERQSTPTVITVILPSCFRSRDFSACTVLDARSFMPHCDETTLIGTWRFLLRQMNLTRLCCRGYLLLRPYWRLLDLHPSRLERAAVSPLSFAGPLIIEAIILLWSRPHPVMFTCVVMYKVWPSKLQLVNRFVTQNRGVKEQDTLGRTMTRASTQSVK